MVDGIIALSPNLSVKFPSLMIRLAAEKANPLCWLSQRNGWNKGRCFPMPTTSGAVGPLAARYMDQIFKGPSPADLPVEQPRSSSS